MKSWMCRRSWRSSSRTSVWRSSSGLADEELVLGEGLEELDERLVVVRALEEVLGDGDLAELAARGSASSAGRLHVRLASEETEQPQCSATVLPRGVDALDRDVVHLGAPVDGRESVRLGDDEQVAAHQALA